MNAVQIVLSPLTLGALVFTVLAYPNKYGALSGAPAFSGPSASASSICSSASGHDGDVYRLQPVLRRMSRRFALPLLRLLPLPLLFA